MARVKEYLSEKEFQILKMLAHCGELCGQDFVKLSDGKIGRGTVYVTLERLEANEYVESHRLVRHPGAIGLPRRLYKVTSTGRRAVAAVEMSRAILANRKPDAVEITEQMIWAALQAQQEVSNPHVSLLRVALEAAAPLIIEAYERAKTGDASP